MYNVCLHCIVFELWVSEKKKKKEWRLAKLKFSCLVFSTSRKDSGINRIDLAIEYSKGMLYLCTLYSRDKIVWKGGTCVLYGVKHTHTHTHKHTHKRKTIFHKKDMHERGKGRSHSLVVPLNVCKLFALLLCFSWSCSYMYALCTGSHFEPAPSVTKTVLLDHVNPHEYTCSVDVHTVLGKISKLLSFTCVRYLDICSLLFMPTNTLSDLLEPKMQWVIAFAWIPGLLTCMYMYSYNSVC